MDINALKPYNNNPKKHDKKQIWQVANSIKRFGFIQPIVIDKKNEIVIGHCRYEASKLLGLKEVPTISVENLNDKEVKALRLADNKLNESAWEMKLVIDDLKILDDELLDLTGFDKDLIIEANEKDDEIPENVPVRSKLDNLYELGQHRILCGDSTQKKAVLKLMNGKKADMVFTDPPYGMNLDADFSDMVGIDKGKKYNNVIGDNTDYNPKHIFKDLGYCKEIFLWGADYYAEKVPKRNNGCFIVWDKTESGIRTNSAYEKQFGSNFELCWSKQQHKRQIVPVLWKGIFGLNKEDIKRRIHPTQKPIKLCEWFITHFSRRDKIIIDLFLGSGSTLIACEKTNRICYGMEIDPHYVDIIVQRYCDYTGNYKIKLNDKEIIWQ